MAGGGPRRRPTRTGNGSKRSLLTNRPWFITLGAVLAIGVSALTIVGQVTGLGARLLEFIRGQPSAYNTELLIDTSTKFVGSLAPGDKLGAISKSIDITLAGSDVGANDALALRRFGGSCTDPTNTARLVDFGPHNGDSIRNAMQKLRVEGSATLVKGIADASGDFDKPDMRKALLNRIIVITASAEDACEPDQSTVSSQIAQRLKGLGLKPEFRFIGFGVPDEQRDELTQLAQATGAPPPSFPQTQEELQKSLNHVVNVEPVVNDGQKLVSILNDVTGRISKATQSLNGKNYDTAQREIDAARRTISDTDPAFNDLGQRKSRGTFRTAYTMSAEMRDLQRKQTDLAAALVGPAKDLESAEKSAANGGSQSQVDTKVADYNRRVDEINRVVAQYNDKVTSLQQLLDSLSSELSS